MVKLHPSKPLCVASLLLCLFLSVSSQIFSGKPTALTVYNNKLYFFGSFTSTRSAVFASNGTKSGTSILFETALVLDMYSFSTSSNKDCLLINTGSALWRSDGSTKGTTKVSDLTILTKSYYTVRRGAVDTQPFVIFYANSASLGYEVHRTDGTTEGTKLVKDINIGGDSSSPLVPKFVEFGNTGVVAFAARNSTWGMELWRSDGTSDKTYLIQDMNPYSENSSPKDLCFLPSTNRIYFAASLGSSVGVELWHTDGTAAGTGILKHIQEGSASSSPSVLTLYNGKIYFAATTTDNGTELWTTDGTSQGTIMLKDINEGKGSSSPDNLVVFNNKLFFTAYNTSLGTEVWMSDGTEQGTRILKDIYPGPFPSTGSGPSLLTVCDTKMFFVASDGSGTGRQLWVTDGTEQNTKQVKIIGTSGAPSIESLTCFQSVIYFSANDGKTGNELWRSDGTPEGTWLVVDLDVDFKPVPPVPAVSSTTPHSAAPALTSSLIPFISLVLLATTLLCL